MKRGIARNKAVKGKPESLKRLRALLNISASFISGGQGECARLRWLAVPLVQKQPVTIQPQHRDVDILFINA